MNESKSPKSSIDQNTSNLIRAEVLQILKDTELRIREQELALRSETAAEIQKYREYLQSQLRQMTLGLVALFTIAGAIFVYMFGESNKEAKEAMNVEIDRAFVEYKLMDEYKSRLEKMVTSAVGDQSTQQLIGESVESNVTKYLESGIAKRIQDSVEAKLANENAVSIEETMDRAVDSRFEEVRSVLRESMRTYEENLISWVSRRDDAFKDLVVDMEVLKTHMNNLTVFTLATVEIDEAYSDAAKTLESSRDRLGVPDVNFLNLNLKLLERISQEFPLNGKANQPDDR